MVGIEPAVVGVAEAVEGADVDHVMDLGGMRKPSSVSDVTVKVECEGVNQGSFHFLNFVGFADSEGPIAVERHQAQRRL